MIDFDELLSDNHSLSINQINHSSEIIFFAENQMTIDRSKSSLLLKDLDVDRQYHQFISPTQGYLLN